jgi:hypothetical protein
MAEIKTTPVRLTELHPKWAGPPDDPRSAIQFDCPCRQGAVTQGAACTWGPVYLPLTGDDGWVCTGDAFEFLSLTPSVHCPGHWHGWVRNGLVESC